MGLQTLNLKAAEPLYLNLCNEVAGKLQSGRAATYLCVFAIDCVCRLDASGAAGPLSIAAVTAAYPAITMRPCPRSFLGLSSLQYKNGQRCTKQIGTSTQHLLSFYLVGLDLASSVAQLTVLM